MDYKSSYKNITINLSTIKFLFDRSVVFFTFSLLINIYFQLIMVDI